MIQRTSLSTALIVLCVFHSAVFAGELHVGPGEAHTTIQSAIDAAVTGDVVIVADGVYTGQGNRDMGFAGKTITVRSENGPQNCIIDCQTKGRAFLFLDGEDGLLDGLTIINSLSSGGAVRCSAGSPTIKNCIFRHNASYTGYIPGAGAILNARGSQTKIQFCTFEHNTSGAIISNRCSTLIENCIFSNNKVGAAIRNSGSSARIVNCLITGNLGGAISNAYNGERSHSTIIHCTITGNKTSSHYPIGASNGDVILLNTIVWDNQGTHGIVPSVQYSSSQYVTVTAENCCIQLLPYSYGDSNIDTNPRFVSPGHWAGDTWIDGDYRLAASSPCIDAAPGVGVDIDLVGVERPFDHPLANSNMTLYDMGAYETVGISRTPVSLQISGPAEVGRYSQVQYQVFAHYEDGSAQEIGSLANWSLDTAIHCSIDSEGILAVENVANDGTITLSASYTENDTTVNGSLQIAYTRDVHTLYVDAVHGSDDNDGTSIQEAFATIQKGIEESDKNFTVIVYPGTYYESVDFLGKEITVTSLTPEKWDSVRQTRIVSDGDAVIVSTCRIIGLSIEGGDGLSDSGIRSGGITDVLAYSPVIKHCYIHSQTGIEITAFQRHAGNGPLIENNIIVSFWKGIYLNYRTDFDGVAQTTIRNNVIFGDGSPGRIGIQYRMQYEQPDVRSNIISNFEKGIDFAGENLIQERKDRIRYNNVWGNVHNYWCNRLDSEFDLTGVQGNISSDPQFVDAGDHEFHLLAGSPCIDAGDPDFVPAPGETDLNGNPRVSHCVVDIGAYELPNGPPVADAGDDADIFAGVGGIVEIELDGSGSWDPDGDELSYRWLLDGAEIAVGAKPLIELPVGGNLVELVVSDGCNEASDTVAVEVVAPIETTVRLAPQAINRKSRGRSVLAIMQLPEGVDASEIDKGYGVVFEPGGVEARLWHVLVDEGEKNLFAMFDRDKVIDALGGEGDAEVNVVCRLVSGRYLYGSDKIKVIDND